MMATKDFVNLVLNFNSSVSRANLSSVVGALLTAVKSRARNRFHSDRLIPVKYWFLRLFETFNIT